MIAVIDYDAGNLKSVEKALLHLGQKVRITRDKNEILQADKVILPGVGSFGEAMNKLRNYQLIDVIKEVAHSSKPLLGICLGLQLFFEESEESIGVEGLSILKGKILRIPDKEGLKIPHIGWNSLSIKPEAKLYKGLTDQSHVYFVHSYYLSAEDKTIVSATTDYSTLIHASVESENIFACQFHPEKSGEVGLTILRNFATL